MESFVIRVWTPAEQERIASARDLRGLIEHIGSGERDAFRGAGELLAFLETRLGAKPEPGRLTLSSWPPVPASAEQVD
jgi:hypothetical protein